jgi:hypothetical protein
MEFCGLHVIVSLFPKISQTQVCLYIYAIPTHHHFLQGIKNKLENNAGTKALVDGLIMVGIKKGRLVCRVVYDLICQTRWR